jgi:uncharacterized protein (TIGR02266 family)
MATQKEERRRYLRLDLDNNMMVRYGHKGEFYFGSCRNLSPGGLFVATKTPAPFGSEVTLKFTLPGHERPLKASGQVVRVHRDVRNCKSTGPAGMHIRFVNVEPIIEEEIRSFVAPRIRQMVIRKLVERKKTPPKRSGHA